MSELMWPIGAIALIATGLTAAIAMVYLARLAAAEGAARRSLSDRNATVDRLLEFSQSIQGVGREDQVFATLAHFLQSELKLSGLGIIGYEADGAKVHAILPAGASVPSLADFDGALCPCLRQNLPRSFASDCSPVRCAIDNYFRFSPHEPAYCIPFAIGRKAQIVVHMLLPKTESWTEQCRQLAQTYVNSAHAALTNLYLLAEAEKQSMTDALTGLYNRRSMEPFLLREMALAERHDHALSLVMIDMDHFKEINDSHGHAAGDHMLRAFGDCVRITLRKTDLAFRYGGDEFTIVLPQTHMLQAQQVVQKLRQAFASVDFSSAITNLQSPPTLSIGVAERSKAANILTHQALLTAADQALYNAKTSTRNCIKLYEPPQAA